MSTTCSKAEDISALYLHVPFCVQRCRYCDFATEAAKRSDPLIASYMDALVRVVARLGEAGLLSSLRTAYVGGGTPSFAGKGLVRLVEQARSASGSSLGEFTSEANPESLDDDLARELACAGLTRISLGVQSLDDAELARLGRAHNAKGARRAMRSVVGGGLALSCDLMCGIPLQTSQSWRASLLGVLDEGAGHVSCYPLMVEEGTPLYAACDAGEEAWPDDDAQADFMLASEQVLREAGLARYEVASYARTGCACAHNVAYWTGASYLGLGSAASSMMAPDEFAALAEALPLVCVPEDPGDALHELWESIEVSSVLGSCDGSALLARPRSGTARSSLPPVPGRALAGRMAELGVERVARVRMRLTASARSFVECISAARPLAASIETLSAREALAEDLMLAMRMSAGAPPELLTRARAEFGGELEKVIAHMHAAGLIEQGPADSWKPTERGWLLGNELYGAFWDLSQ